MTQSTTSAASYSRFVNWLIAVALMGLGTYLTWVGFLGQEWLTRAGCLVVMLGIWSGLGGIIQERVLRTRIRQKQRNAIVRERARLSEQDVDEQMLEAELARIDESYEAQIAHAAERLRFSVGFEEVSLLLTGTFVWGFGDLICC